jgi:hypothetical protein
MKIMAFKTQNIPVQSLIYFIAGEDFACIVISYTAMSQSEGVFIV